MGTDGKWGWKGKEMVLSWVGERGLSNRANPTIDRSKTGQGRVHADSEIYGSKVPRSIFKEMFIAKKNNSCS